jgi:membrane protein
MTYRDIKGLSKATFSAWIDDKVPKLSAALAYYTVFALAPVLLIAVAIGSLVFKAESVRGLVVAQIQNLVGPQSAEAIKAIITGAERTGHGVLAAILGAITIFLQLREFLESSKTQLILSGKLTLIKTLVSRRLLKSDFCLSRWS